MIEAEYGFVGRPTMWVPCSLKNIGKDVALERKALYYIRS